MNTKEMLEKQKKVTVHVVPERDMEVTGGFTGDLLSFVMGSAPEGTLWVTIQNHVNVAAVALLKEIPLILLASGRSPSPELKEQCIREGIALATADMDSFNLCGVLHGMGVRDRQG